jgi:RNA polymerase sigma factor (sigma-70 family)
MAAVREEAALRFIRNLLVRDQFARLPDSKLLDRFVASRDQEAFAAIVRRHGPMVLRVCLQVLDNEPDAEDAFQATFLILSRKASSVKKQQSVGSWLFGVANHAAMDLKRKRARRRSHESQAAEPSVSDPLSALTLREAQTILNEELARLSERYRAPLVLCSLEGLTRDEAARQLGLPLGTLKSRLEKARKRLRVRLTARGLTLSGAFVASVFGEQVASAAIPTGLLNSTVQAATSVAAGQAVAAGAISLKVAALTEGVMKAMLLAKLKTSLVGFLLMLGVVGFGGWLLTHHPAAAQQVKAEPEHGNPANRKPDALYLVPFIDSGTVTGVPQEHAAKKDRKKPNKEPKREEPKPKPATQEEEIKSLIDKVMKAHGGEKLTKLKAFSQKIKVSHDGKDSTVEIFVQLPDQYRSEGEEEIGGKSVKSLFVLNGEQRWRKRGDDTEELPKDETATQNNKAMLEFYGPKARLMLKDLAGKLSLLEETTIGDRAAVGVKFTPAEGLETRLYFDKKKALLLKEEFVGNPTDEVLYSDYKEIKGIPIAHKIVKKRDGIVTSEEEVLEFRVVDKLEAKLFQKP